MRLLIHTIFLGLALPVFADDRRAWLERCLASTAPVFTETADKDWPSASSCAGISVKYCRFDAMPDVCLAALDHSLSEQIKLFEAQIPSVAAQDLPESAEYNDLEYFFYESSLRNYFKMETAGPETWLEKETWGELTWLGEARQKHFFQLINRISFLPYLVERFQELETQ